VSLAGELLDGWAPVMRGVELQSGTKGRFEVSLDGEVIFSKSAAGRHARSGEIRAEVERRIGKALDWRG
jgi:predicted Rdx family selenoprotein